MQEQLIGALGRALIPAITAAALPAHALVLGELEVRSALGEALDARIVLEQADAQAVDASCFSLTREGAGGIPTIGEGILTVERATGRPVLRIRTLGGIYEPALALRVRAACPGEAGAVLRQYSVLLDPRPGIQVVAAPPVLERIGSPGSATELAGASAGAPQPAPPVASLRARGGDSLRSIAAAVFPRDRLAQAQYLSALREANPALASQPVGDTLAEGTVIALPDLRTYARAAIDASRAPARQERPRRAPAEAKPVADAPGSRARPAAPGARAQSAPPSTPARAAAPAPRVGDAFVLKLSSSEVDLSRTRGVDDRVRSQLRERLLVLDADDQVSALLAMRNSLRQLENRVSELQLKLAAMPPSLAAGKVAEGAAPAKAAQPGATPAAPAAEPIVATPAAEAPSAASGPSPAPVVSATPAAPVAPAPAPATATAEEAPKPAAEPAAPSRPSPRQPSRFELSPWLWGLVALLTVLALLLAWSLRRRRSQSEELYEYEDQQAVSPDEVAAPAEPLGELQRDDLRATIESDAHLPTRLADDSSQLRRRYIEERFPEVANRTISLEQPDSVVKGARLFYEDGAVTRAVELLQFAIEENPDEVRLWLALFEIHRLEGNTEAFAALARRFRERHEKSGYWLKVQYIGREIDSANPLYRDESFSKLETIGPSTARRLAAATYDPIAENWLNAPMDFQNQVLASELRRALMTYAAVAEQDLVPNPMPALRNVEMFTLA